MHTYLYTCMKVQNSTANPRTTLFPLSLKPHHKRRGSGCYIYAIQLCPLLTGKCLCVFALSADDTPPVNMLAFEWMMVLFGGCSCVYRCA